MSDDLPGLYKKNALFGPLAEAERKRRESDVGSSESPDPSWTPPERGSSYYVRPCERGDYCQWRFLRREIDEDLEYVADYYRCTECLAIYAERIHAQRVTISFRPGLDPVEV